MAKQLSNKHLFLTVKSLIYASQSNVIRSVNTTLLLTYSEIGRLIIESEQSGADRAQYAKEIIPKLSAALTKEFGRGYSTTNLEYFRKFYLVYQKQISQTVSGKSKKAISQTLSGKFNLSWSHYVLLLKMDDSSERTFYEIEASKNNWSVRELQRQYETSLYERLALSRDKKGVKQLAMKGQLLQKPTDVLKSHYVLEFLGMKEQDHYTENDLESAIINKLEHFLLELGNGFLFEGRQKRFTFEGDSFYVDLVFYNRLLKCFVLFDLKLGKLSHQDIGQMQMYVNYYDRFVKTRGERPTIGIVLCKEENKTVVEITLPKNNKQIFAKEYKRVLPSKVSLRKQLE